MGFIYDAMIIGAGPAGSATAILLARNGWRVALIERVEFPRRKVCGECIAASNLPLLGALGVGEALADMGGLALRDIALNYRDRTLRAPLPMFNSARHPWGYAVAREVLDTLLLEQAKKAGATLFCPWSASDVRGVFGADVLRHKERSYARNAATWCARIDLGQWLLGNRRGLFTLPIGFGSVCIQGQF